MGRVYDALKRAATPPSGEPKRRKPSNSAHPKGSAARLLPAAQEIEKQLLAGSTILTAANAAHFSASTAHTANAPDGSALPDGIASRDAGATLGAAGPARAAEFKSYTISAARVEPLLVAITQPRSAYNEQFRALRTEERRVGKEWRSRWAP